MVFNTDRIEEYIKDYYKHNQPDLKLTKSITERIADVIMKNESFLVVSKEILEQKVIEFLGRENTLKFVKERQPVISKVPDEVIRNISEYICGMDSAYELDYVCRKSNHPEDSYKYSLVAKKNNEYVCWTSWNELTKSMNHGHYGLSDRNEAINILKDNFFDITDEPEQFGMEHSSRDIAAEHENQQHIQEQSEFAKRTGRRQHR